jgi:hypothetical protein
MLNFAYLINIWNASKPKITFYNSTDIRYDSIKLVLVEKDYIISTKKVVNYSDQTKALFDHPREQYYERSIIID